MRVRKQPQSVLDVEHLFHREPPGRLCLRATNRAHEPVGHQPATERRHRASPRDRADPPGRIIEP
jgi:hypothetical protein